MIVLRCYHLITVFNKSHPGLILSFTPDILLVSCLKDFLFKDKRDDKPKSVTLLETNLNSGADLSCVPVVSGEAAVAEHILQ